MIPPPSGPFAIPFFGNVLQILWQTPKVALPALTKKYGGGIFSFRVFSQR